MTPLGMIGLDIPLEFHEVPLNLFELFFKGFLGLASCCFALLAPCQIGLEVLRGGSMCLTGLF